MIATKTSDSIAPARVIATGRAGVRDLVTELGAERFVDLDRERFEDAFARYLPAQASPRHNPATTRVSEDFASVTEGDVCRMENSSESSIGAGCDGVTDKTSPTGEREKDVADKSTEEIEVDL